MKYIKASRIELVMVLGFLIQGPVLAEGDYPAAYFEPYIVYQAPEISANALAAVASDAFAESSVDVSSEPAEVDPYPAANFQPVIIYQDKELIAALAKRQKAERGQASTTVGIAADQPKYSKATPLTGPITDDGGVPISVLFLIVALAGGFYWLIKKDKNKVAD